MKPNPGHKGQTYSAFGKQLLPSQKLLLAQRCGKENSDSHGAPAASSATLPRMVAINLGGSPAHSTGHPPARLHGTTPHLPQVSSSRWDSAGTLPGVSDRHRKAGHLKGRLQNLHCLPLSSRFETQELLIQFTISTVTLIPTIDSNLFSYVRIY